MFPFLPNFFQQRGQDRQIGWFPADYVRLVNANSVPGELLINKGVSFV